MNNPALPPGRKAFYGLGGPWARWILVERVREGYLQLQLVSPSAAPVEPIVLVDYVAQCALGRQWRLLME